jgi:hypothetical protein
MFSEQDVDRELKAALSVSPSPDFEARVRQRVDADRPVRVGMFSVARGLPPSLKLGRTGKTPGLLVAASVVLVAGLFYALSRTPAVPVPTTPQVVERAAPMPPTAAPAPPNPVETAIPRATVTDRPSAPAVVVRAQTPQPQARAAQPEVIIPPQQLAAVRRLVREVNAGRNVPEPVRESATGEPAAVVVIPLAIEPLTVPTLEASGGVPSSPKGLQ